MMKEIKALQEIINQEIESLQFGDHPAELYDPIRYILSLGGKRMRPLLVVLGYQLFKNDPEKIVRTALSVEVFHNFTLMHDDIMDEAPLRRGQPTVHEKWDDTVAILSGDTMLVKAYDLLLEVPAQLLPQVIKGFNKCAVEVCEGQQIDMNFESQAEVSVDEYLEMIRLKTAVLLGYSLQLGALLAGATEDQQRSLYQVGEQMGIGFQLMDDLLDVYADQAKFGKQVGGDIVSNKKTYLLISALAKANEEQGKALNDWIGKSTFDQEEKVQAVTAIYDDLGIKEQTTQKMNGYFNKAFKQLERLEATAEGKDLLSRFARQLMSREK